jgi:secreted protein with Ig-like and vWFA domain
MGSSAMKVLLNTFQNTEDAYTTYATSDLITLEITGTVSKTEATPLGIPVSYLNVIVEDFGFYASIDSEEPDTVFEIGMLENGSEGVVEDAFSLTVRTDGNPSEITAPATEPTYITSMEQLQEVMQSIQEKFYSYVGA